MVSPWMSLMARDVGVFTPCAAADLSRRRQADYIAIVAYAGRRAPIVRHTGPRSKHSPGNCPPASLTTTRDPAEGCRREFLEETGFVARAIHPLAKPPMHGAAQQSDPFILRGSGRGAWLRSSREPGLTVKLVGLPELARNDQAGEFISQLHIGALLLAELHGFLVCRASRGEPKRAQGPAASCPGITA